MIYTKHARERMILRTITEDDVENIIHSYEVALPGHTGATNYYKVIGTRRLRVTAHPDPTTGELVVRTVTEEEL